MTATMRTCSASPTTSRSATAVPISPLSGALTRQVNGAAEANAKHEKIALTGDDCREGPPQCCR
jgi:hypothetical protein